MVYKNLYYFSVEELSIQIPKRPQEISRISCIFALFFVPEESQLRERREITKNCKKGEGAHSARISAKLSFFEESGLYGAQCWTALPKPTNICYWTFLGLSPSANTAIRSTSLSSLLIFPFSV
jgi:hypothetical protein